MVFVEFPITIQNQEMPSNKQKCNKGQHYYHKRKRFPGKISSVSIIASINKSIVKCRDHLNKFLSELARMVTPTCRLKGFEILRQEEKTDLETNKVVGHPGLELEFETSFNIVPPVLVIHRNRLPPMVSDKKGTIVLDLDETLVHSCLDPPPPRYDFIVSRNMDGVTINFYVLKRPGIDEFLETISKKYELVVFTAGHVAYASKVLDTLDPKGLISHRLYRDSCKQVRGRFVKDLSRLGRDLRKTVIVDDNPKSFALQPKNGIPIKPFVGDQLWDNELMKLTVFFETCNVFEDMRDTVNQYLGTC
ncbi:Haloacid dehalogenase hydrolase domain-containing protein [Theobroma cacao]|uniref:Haloacid dehalogenase hydrolase domain-containing protein n=1 Tax=Theobroma cacao TaxID=3641 RepID=A0A061GLC1_THECC|nr:Haloacid dehalogenase hydrolase domain-containing protein [Theobroma cacao]